MDVATKKRRGIGPCVSVEPKVIVLSNYIDTATLIAQLSSWYDYAPKCDDNLDGLKDADDPKNTSLLEKPPVVALAKPDLPPKPPKPKQSTNNSFTIEALKCLQVGCASLWVDEAQLQEHLMTSHGIQPHRCLLKDCGRSFADSKTHDDHLATHAQTSTLSCAYCPSTFLTYANLFVHTTLTHYEGQFRCTTCHTFVGFTRHQMTNHNRNVHKLLVCPNISCHRSFKHMYNLRRHLRTHTGLKPYRCTWTGCSYVSEHESPVVRHIRVTHLKLPKTVKEQLEKNIVSTKDPKEYLSIDKQLVEEVQMEMDIVK